ncbi:hypothetical protein GCM10007205_03650 [Oxalicibacterium flavum]|uniref:Uncharacterized protein n=1 Tax=Oxalicibacterium flavum TaxID=179467 RepID=A0A8J2XYG2_9BURK|nr:hypothetical protein [Oxalicibacterium flavum]GGB97644.1 hypothetical protein GCM10007205_03650 [Oxalicibacterium flavum]
MLLSLIGLFVVYAISHYLITINRRDLFATILVIGLPFVGLYYLGWMSLLYCLAGAYLGTKAGLKKLQRTKTLRTSFYTEDEEAGK